MTDISLYDITFVVEDDDGNSKLYTTNMDYDHSFIASLVDLDDLVPIEDVKNAETFEANGCVGCQMQKPVSKEERAAIQKQVDKFNEQLALDPDDDFERYILLDLDDENLIEDAFFSRQTWKPLTEAFRKRWGERSELMDKISLAQLGEKSNWSIYSFEKPFWFEYECDPQDTATAEDPEGYGLGFEFDMTKEEAIEKARQIHKETKGAITMFNNARKRSGGGSTRIHPKFWATPEMMEEQKEYYKREDMEWPTGHWIEPDKFQEDHDGKKIKFNAETTMTVEHKDGSRYRYSETDPIYGEMGEIVGHVSEITDEQDTPYQKIYGRDVTREHNFYLDAETFDAEYDFQNTAIHTVIADNENEALSYIIGADRNDPDQWPEEEWKLFDIREAETFEAREKKIGSIRIVKNPNFPSGTSLQAYIKTNRAELRKVFGNPNMAESGDGKSKGKEWNLIVGGKKVTIYDKREKDKKGTKYFNIGGSGKFGALLVAQALSIHRNERVRAKETVPKWLEDKGHHQQVKSIDEHPDLTYQRAKEYWENTGRYGAESNNEKILVYEGYRDTIDKFHGKFDTLEDAENHIYEKLLKEFLGHREQILKELNDPATDWEKHYSTKEYTQQTFDEHYSDIEGQKKKLREISQTPKGSIQQSGSWLYQPNGNPPMYQGYSQRYEDGTGNYPYIIFDSSFSPPSTEMNAETFDVEFNEWAEQEMMSHGKDISFKDWAEDEGMKHGNTEITDWAQHEDESHDARYGAETSEDNIKRFKVGEQYTHRYYHGYGFSDYEVMRRTDKSVWFSKVNPETGKVDSPLLVSRHKLHTMQPFELDGEIIDGLEMVRLQMGHPVKAGQTTMSKYAETSGQWEIGEQLEEAQMNAESPKDSDMMGKRWAVYHTTIPQEWLEANRRPSGGYPHHEPTLDISHQFYGDERIAFDPQYYEKVATATFNEGYDGGLLWRLTNNVDESWSRDFVLPNTFEWGEMKRNKPLHIDENGKEWGLRSSMVGDIFHDLENDEMWIVAPYGFEKVHNPQNKTFDAEKGKKRSSLLSNPFDELSLDSGKGKKWLAVGIIGGLAYLGYNKWK